MKVGVIGLGHMGSGMAANLLKGGHEVTVYNRTPGKAQALVAQGACYATRVADACRGDAVITMLADGGGARGEGPSFCLGSGVWPIRGGGCSQALHRRGRRAGMRWTPACPCSRPSEG